MTHKKTQKFTLKDIDRALEMSHLLAKAFPDPQACVTGIYELLLNAIEHGNLGIGLSEKTNLLRHGQWRDEIMRRAALPENAAKQVDIELISDINACRLMIRDQGCGFAWKKYKKNLPAAKRPNGRGLLIAFNSAFDAVAFNPAGNQVVCVAGYGFAKSRRPY